MLLQPHFQPESEHSYSERLTNSLMLPSYGTVFPIVGLKVGIRMKGPEVITHLVWHQAAQSNTEAVPAMVVANMPQGTLRWPSVERAAPLGTGPLCWQEMWTSTQWEVSLQSCGMVFLGGEGGKGVKLDRGRVDLGLGQGRNGSKGCHQILFPPPSHGM